jgi:hypothetical protein
VVGSPIQQQSLRRKVLYSVLIVALFCAMLMMRRLRAYGIDTQAQKLDIAEENIGEVELVGSALRLSLLGSRGLAVCYLWYLAQDKQKMHEWNELELVVRSLIKLQPHYPAPWRFQSWNLSYNVSVECDRIKDKYYWISRGMEFMSEGERQNRGNPDMRYDIGFFNQHKIGLADEANTFRSLLEMSCIDPIERDPARLRTRDKNNRLVPDMERFEEFCRKHPLLVRRLREQLKRETPDDIIDFLAENNKIPSRYQEGSAAAAAVAQLQTTPLKPQTEQFPILPPPDPEGRREVSDPTAKDFGNFYVARDWYEYAQEPLPPPTRDLDMNPPPYDPRLYRMPRYMASLIFRDYPARAQNYVAEYLQREGWFDSDGWIIKGWFPDNKLHNGGDAVVGTDADWSVNAWKKSFARWKRYGQENGMYLDPAEVKDCQNRAKAYRDRYHLSAAQPPIPLRPEDRAELQDSYKAHAHLYWLGSFQNMTNFPHFYYEAEAEANPATVHARKELFKAEQFRKAADQEEALDRYAKVLPKWGDILRAHPDHLRDPSTQEDTYEFLVSKYLDLVDDLYGRRLKELLIVQNMLGQAALRPPLGTVWLPPPYFLRDMRANVETPLDGLLTTLNNEQLRQRVRAPRSNYVDPAMMSRMMSQQQQQMQQQMQR